MKLSIKKRFPKQARWHWMFLWLPMRWDDNTVLWLEWIRVWQVRDVIGMWEDVDYYRKTRSGGYNERQA
jgi:hypothetical protein